MHRNPGGRLVPVSSACTLPQVLTLYGFARSLLVLKTWYQGVIGRGTCLSKLSWYLSKLHCNRLEFLCLPLCYQITSCRVHFWQVNKIINKTFLFFMPKVCPMIFLRKQFSIGSAAIFCQITMIKDQLY